MNGSSLCNPLPYGALAAFDHALCVSSVLFPRLENSFETFSIYSVFSNEDCLSIEIRQSFTEVSCWNKEHFFATRIQAGRYFR